MEAQPNLPPNQQPAWIAKVCDISVALKGENEPFPWAIEGLIVQHSANCVSGHPHGMKSFNMLAGCMELAHTQTLWGKFKAPNIKKTLFVETEDGKPMLEARIRGLLRGLGIEDAKQLPDFHYARFGPFDLVRMQDELIAVIQHFKPDFVVLSTLQGLLGNRAWNQQNEMAEVNALFVKIGEMLPGGLTVITHSPLDTEAKRPAGTVTQLANYTTAIHFRKTIGNGKTQVDVRVDSKLGCEEDHFLLDVILGESPEGETEVRKVEYSKKKQVTKKEIVIAVFKSEGLEAKTGDVVAATISRLPEGETVTDRYVNTIRKELQKEESEQRGTSSTLLVPS